MQEIMRLAHEFLQNFCAGNQQNQALLHKHINLFLNPGVRRGPAVHLRGGVGRGRRPLHFAWRLLGLTALPRLFQGTHLIRSHEDVNLPSFGGRRTGRRGRLVRTQ